MPSLTLTIAALEEIEPRYAALFCDVWGVLHDGVRAFPHAAAALAGARSRGARVVLITNAPRRNGEIISQLRSLGVPDAAWDRVVTSGDVTRDLIARGPRRTFHLGPDRDLSLYDGLDSELVEEFEADGVVCTGLFDDETETPEDYRGMLARLRARDLPMICANPDIVVHRGEQLIWCAGSLARDYALFGGRTFVAGKPFAPIYDAALLAVGELSGRSLDRREVLAIGDGMLTDIKGAVDNGFDALYISGGIHAGDYGPADEPDPQRLSSFLERHGLHPVAVMPKLR